jgi:ElaB/YqjD/DUF883 family membrane-anchored ribosome-binding protein
MADINTATTIGHQAVEQGRAAMEQGQAAMEQGRQAIGQGYDRVREYAEKGADVFGDVSSNLADFVRKEPWIALAAAFAVGYVAARIMRRVAV